MIHWEKNAIESKEHFFPNYSITITVGQSSMQLSPHLLSKNNQILRNDGSFSLNIFRKPHHLEVLN